MPVPHGEDAFLCCVPGDGDLALLRAVRDGRRRVRVRAKEGQRDVRGGAAEAGRAGWRDGRAAAGPGRGGSAAARARGNPAGRRARLFPPDPRVLAGGRGSAAVPDVAGDHGAIDCRLSPRAEPERARGAEAPPPGPGVLRRGHAYGRRAGPAGQRGRRDGRSVPGPADVPDRGPSGGNGRFRRAGAGRREPAKVSELSADAALRQERPSLRAGPRDGVRAVEGAGRIRRGLPRCDPGPPSRVHGRGGGDGDVADGAAGEPGAPVGAAIRAGAGPGRRGGRGDATEPGGRVAAVPAGGRAGSGQRAGGDPARDARSADHLAAGGPRPGRRDPGGP